MISLLICCMLTSNRKIYLSVLKILKYWIDEFFYFFGKHLCQAINKLVNHFVKNKSVQWRMQEVVFYKIWKTRSKRHGVKVGPGPPSKLKSGTPGPPLKFKSGIPSPFFNEFIFFRIFHRFFIFVSFLNKIYTKKNINCELTIAKHIWKRKNYLKKLNRTPLNSNPIEVIFLDRHRLAILWEVYP